MVWVLEGVLSSYGFDGISYDWHDIGFPGSIKRIHPLRGEQASMVREDNGHSCQPEEPSTKG